MSLAPSDRLWNFRLACHPPAIIPALSPRAHYCCPTLPSASKGSQHPKGHSQMLTAQRRLRAGSQQGQLQRRVFEVTVPSPVPSLPPRPQQLHAGMPSNGVKLMFSQVLQWGEIAASHSFCTPSIPQTKRLCSQPFLSLSSVYGKRNSTIAQTKLGDLQMYLTSLYALTDCIAFCT